MANPGLVTPGAVTERTPAAVTMESVDRRIKLFNRVCAGVLIAFLPAAIIGAALYHRHIALADALQIAAGAEVVQ